VRLTSAEITRLAAFKGVSEHEFILQCTRLRWDRGGLALQEKPDGGCVLLEGNDCAVQSVKPQQCRDFPNLWKFPGFEKSVTPFPAKSAQRNTNALLKSN
jgi:Fe-S-cluster containining protein